MVRGSLLVLLAVLAAGCTNYRSRGQGPLADRPRKAPPPPPALPSLDAKTGRTQTPPPFADRAPLKAPDPTPPAPPPGFPGEAAPVPPRPPEPMPPVPPSSTGRIKTEGDTVFGDRVIPKTPAVVPPETPRPPAVPPVAAAQPAPQPAPAARPAPAANPQAEALTRLAQGAAKRWAALDTFEAKLTRREAIGSARPQTEEVILQVRKEPFAVFMRNVGEVGRGREVLYNPTKHDDKVHAIVGEGDSRLYKAGNKAPALSPDSPLVKGKSRRSIRDAGPGSTVALFGRLVQASPGDLKYVGPATRPELGDHPLELVEQAVRAGAEPDVDRAAVRAWYFDAKPDSPSFGLPVLLTLSETGSAPPRELEFYCYTQVKAPAGLTDADFDLARLGRGRR